MEQSKRTLTAIHERTGQHKINQLKHKIDLTKQNIEISKEIIAATPSEAQRRKLIQKNEQRNHALGSLQKEIRDVEQTMKEREREAAT